MELWTKKIAILYISTCDLPLKAPCSLGWVSPRRAQGPGTESILHGRDWEAEGPEPWTVPVRAYNI